MIYRSVFRLTISMILALGIVSCGANVKTKSIKDYRVTLSQGDSSFVPLLKALVSDYNAHVGMQAMQYVDSPAQANSRIVVTQGLEARDNKVGWGQWFSTTESSGANIPGGSVEQVTEFSGQVEFDADFLRENGKIDNGAVQYEVQKLFAHEFGHVFQMEHHPDIQDIMYLNITGVKNFSPYYDRVKSFFLAE